MTNHDSERVRMRFRGKDYDGEGITVAIIDSGINPADPRLAGVEIEGWHIRLGATGHAIIGGDFADANGHGTEIAVAVHRLAPKAKLVGVRIMDAKLKTSADLMAAGIETAARAGAGVINLSLGTPNMGKALLLRDCCALAVEGGAMVLAAAHPKGDRAYPADLPETIGAASHPDCPLDKFYFYARHRFPPQEWGNLTGKFLAHGYSPPKPGSNQRGPYRGSGMATAYLSARAACLREAMPGRDPIAVREVMQKIALTPVPEIGYG
ncbi:MAG: S8 family serine peptidase [Alphaproteobacteria bacterium]|nr:S8 family serine peptidase [Alphaproteobacteria bacterium]